MIGSLTSSGPRTPDLLVALAVIATVTLLVACGAGDEPADEPPASDAPHIGDTGASEPEEEPSPDGAEGARRTLRQPSGDGETPPEPFEDGSGRSQDRLTQDERPSVLHPERTPHDNEAHEQGLDPEQASELEGSVIALDPGHNGGNFDAPGEINRPVDAGGFTKPCNTTGTATQDGYRESTFNLEVAELLRARLEAAGASVHLTRTDDDGVGPCIDVRGTFGQKVGADLTISIHADGADAGARGFHIIQPGEWSGSDPAVLDASAELAKVLRDALVDYGKSPANYVGTDGLVVRSDLATLNLSEVPVVLLEAGNMRNAEDAAELRDPHWQADLADALVDGVERFLLNRASS